MIDDAARERVRRQIGTLRAQYGAAVADDPATLRALLLDTLPADRKAIEEATAVHRVDVVEPRIVDVRALPADARVWGDDVPSPKFGSVQSSGGSANNLQAPLSEDLVSGLPLPGGLVADHAVPVGPPSDDPPPVGPRPGDGSAGTGGRGRSSRRGTWIAAGAAVMLLALAVTAGASGALWAEGGDAKEPGATKVPREEVARATGHELVAAPDISPENLTATSTMGARDAGVDVHALSEVKSVGSGANELAPPEGGKLIAFRLGSGYCAAGSCESWRSLNLAVTVDGDRRPLPSGDDGDTFVVAAPAGTRTVDLVMAANGYPQELSLLDGSPGPHNIAVLARDDVYDIIDQRFTATVRASIALTNGAGPGENIFYRKVHVESAQLHFFLEGKRPSSPDKAFLNVVHSYSLPGLGKNNVYAAATVTFISADGSRYPVRDITPNDQYGNTVFEVPADTSKGTLIFGGKASDVATNGTPFTETVQTKRIPIDFSDDD